MFPFYRNRLHEQSLPQFLQFIFVELRGWMQRTLSDVVAAVMFSVSFYTGGSLENKASRPINSQ